jgi:hypothetical protein
MGKINKVIPVKLICGIITSDENNFNIARKELSKKFGAIDYKSPISDFNLTDYYQKEMGPNLKRRFLSFSKLIIPAEIIKIKHLTNKLEVKYSKNGKRLINIDPGYISASKLVLATTKDYFHRIYLDKGIFAEVTLYFRAGSFTPFDWTYPDYKSKNYIEAFNRIREIYMRQVKYIKSEIRNTKSETNSKF